MLDKVIAITGASSGIGKSAALHLAKKGAKTVLASRDGKGLAAVADRIGVTGGAALPVVTDMSCRAHLVEAATELRPPRRLGELRWYHADRPARRRGG